MYGKSPQYVRNSWRVASPSECEVIELPAITQCSQQPGRVVIVQTLIRLLIGTSIDLRISYIKDSFKCATFECQSKALTDQTPGPVTSDDVPGCDCLNCIVAGFDLSGDAIGILGETREFCFP